LKEEKMRIRHREEIAGPWELVPTPRSDARLPFFEEGIAVVEFPLLMTVHQAMALEGAAHRSGLTVGEMARRLIRDFLDREEKILCRCPYGALQLRKQGFEIAHAWEGLFDVL
jgi:hypothetical protein